MPRAAAAAGDASAPITLTPLAPPPSAPTPLVNVMSKFSATFYGFVEADAIFDSTQSFNDLAGNAAILHTPAPTTTTPNPTAAYGAEHGRTTFSARNSRLGFKLKGPETDTIKTSGIVECDFLGNQPQGSPGSPAGIARRLRGVVLHQPDVPHAPLLRSSWRRRIIDVLAGQYWQLFGWQSMFHPNTVEMQGVPGQIYSRSPQFRLSHDFKTDAVNVEHRRRRRRARRSVTPRSPTARPASGWRSTAGRGCTPPGAAGSAIDAAVDRLLARSAATSRCRTSRPRPPRRSRSTATATRSTR